MARTVDRAAHSDRRDAFLDAAERLIRTCGYDQMTVQDVLDELGASKGAFYHYFDSKETLLEAVIERMTDAAMGVIDPIANDPDLSAAVKLQAVFSAGGQWKTERSDLLLGLIRSWYSEENDLVRLRVARMGAERLVPTLAAIIRQGVAEASFSPRSPRHTASILAALLLGSGDTFSRLVVDRDDGRIAFDEAERYIDAYNEAVERILGLRPGSFVLVDSHALHVWFD
jgi:AcrR family transcriptional regulator